MKKDLVSAAKKRALIELIRQMRKRELAEGDDEPADALAALAAKDDVLEVDDEGDDVIAADDDDDDDGDDDESALRDFMRQSSTSAPRGRSTIVIDVGRKHGPAQIKKAVGGKS